MKFRSFRRLARLSLAVTTLALLIGFGGTLQAQGTFKIGIALPTTQEVVWPLMAETATALANAAGYEAVTVSADNQLQNQVDQVNNLIAQDVDAILIGFVNTDAAAGICDTIRAAGIVLIQMDRLGSNCNGNAYVTADSTRVARSQMGLLAGVLGGSGNIIIIGGATGNSVADAFEAGYNDVLPLYPNLKVVAFQRIENWSPAGALAFVENTLAANDNDVQGIVSMNDGMILGALQGVEAAGLKIPLLGSDAEGAAVINVIDGRLLATVDKSPNAIGGGAFKAAQAILEKAGSIPSQNGTINDGSFDVPLVLTEIFVVTRQSLLNNGSSDPTLQRVSEACQARPDFEACK